MKTLAELGISVAVVAVVAANAYCFDQFVRCEVIWWRRWNERRRALRKEKP